MDPRRRLPGWTALAVASSLLVARAVASDLRASVPGAVPHRGLQERRSSGRMMVNDAFQTLLEFKVAMDNLTACFDALESNPFSIWYDAMLTSPIQQYVVSDMVNWTYILPTDQLLEDFAAIHGDGSDARTFFTTEPHATTLLTSHMVQFADRDELAGTSAKKVQGDLGIRYNSGLFMKLSVERSASQALTYRIERDQDEGADVGRPAYVPPSSGAAKLLEAAACVRAPTLLLNSDTLIGCPSTATTSMATITAKGIDPTMPCAAFFPNYYDSSTDLFETWYWPGVTINWPGYSWWPYSSSTFSNLSDEIV